MSRTEIKQNPQNHISANWPKKQSHNYLHFTDDETEAKWTNDLPKATDQSRAELRLERAQGSGSQAGSLPLLLQPHLDDTFTRLCPSQTRGDLAASRQPAWHGRTISRVSITSLGGSLSISHDGIFWIVCALSVPWFESFCGIKWSSSSRSGYLDFSPQSTGSSGSILQFTEDSEAQRSHRSNWPKASQAPG